MRPAGPCRWSPSGSRPVLSSSSNRGALQTILPASFSGRTKPPSTSNLTFSNQEWFLPRGATHRGSLTLAAASKPQLSRCLRGPGCPGWGLQGPGRGLTSLITCPIPTHTYTLHPTLHYGILCGPLVLSGSVSHSVSLPLTITPCHPQGSGPWWGLKHILCLTRGPPWSCNLVSRLPGVRGAADA